MPMNEEMESLQKNQTCDLVKPYEGRQVVGCKWIFKKKSGSSIKEVIRYKETRPFSIIFFVFFKICATNINKIILRTSSATKGLTSKMKRIKQQTKRKNEKKTKEEKRGKEGRRRDEGRNEEMRGKE